MSISHNPSPAKYIVGVGFFFGQKESLNLHLKTLIQSTVQTQQIRAYSWNIYLRG